MNCNKQIVCSADERPIHSCSKKPLEFTGLNVKFDEVNTSKKKHNNSKPKINSHFNQLIIPRSLSVSSPPLHFCQLKNGYDFMSCTSNACKVLSALLSEQTPPFTGMGVLKTTNTKSLVHSGHRKLLSNSHLLRERRTSMHPQELTRTATRKETNIVLEELESVT
jgi:hypothetical protein